VTTNGTQADWMCLLANTGSGAAHKNKSLICVPMKTKGVSVARKLKKLGMWSSDTAQIFSRRRARAAALPHRRGGHGLHLQMLQFQEERLWAAARSMSMGTLIDETANYARERMAFGKSILDNQYVHFKLAELKTEIECLRALVIARPNSTSPAGRDRARFDGEAEGGTPRAPGSRCLPAVLGRHGLHVGKPRRPRLPRRAPVFHRRRRRRNHARHHFKYMGILPRKE